MTCFNEHPTWRRFATPRSYRTFPNAPRGTCIRSARPGTGERCKTDSVYSKRQILEHRPVFRTTVTRSHARQPKAEGVVTVSTKSLARLKNEMNAGRRGWGGGWPSTGPTTGLSHCLGFNSRGCYRRRWIPDKRILCAVSKIKIIVTAVGVHSPHG